MIRKLFSLLLCVCWFSSSTIVAQKVDIQVVVFDFGGVIAKVNIPKIKQFLIDSFYIDENELKIALKNMQNYVSKGGFERQFWEKYAISKSVELPNDWINQFNDVIREAIVEIPGTIAVVKELQCQGYQTALLSDVTQCQASIICTMGYYDLFDPLLLSCEIGVEKPSPEIFNILLKTVNLAASCVLFIDDKTENVEAAKKQGMNAIHFINPEQLRDELRGFGLQSS